MFFNKLRSWGYLIGAVLIFFSPVVYFVAKAFETALLGMLMGISLILMIELDNIQHGRKRPRGKTNDFDDAQ